MVLQQTIRVPWIFKAVFAVLRKEVRAAGGFCPPWRFLSFCTRCCCCPSLDNLMGARGDCPSRPPCARWPCRRNLPCRNLQRSRSEKRPSRVPVSRRARALPGGPLARCRLSRHRRVRKDPIRERIRGRPRLRPRIKPMVRLHQYPRAPTRMGYAPIASPSRVKRGISVVIRCSPGSAAGRERQTSSWMSLNRVRCARCA